jgi:hypothetical protein
MYDIAKSGINHYVPVFGYYFRKFFRGGKHLVHIYFGFSAHFSFPNTDTHFGENSHMVHFILIHTFGSSDNSL